MNNINYAEIFQTSFDKTFGKEENNIENHLKKNKEQGRSFSFLYNPILNSLEALKNDKYYITTSNLFEDVLKIYNERSNYYDQNFEHYIFQNELLENFNKINGLKKGYTYKIFLIELGIIEAVSDVYRRFRHNSRIYEMMYNLNQLDEFTLLKASGNVEETYLFKKFLFKTRNFDTPGRYKDFEDFLYLENELELILNPKYPNTLNAPKNKNSKKLDCKNFKIKESHKHKLEMLFLLFDLSEDTKKESFLAVFLKDWDKKNHTIKFDCSTQLASYLLYNIKYLFNNFNGQTIEKSELFYTMEGNLLSADNIYQSKKNINPEDKKTAEKILEKVKNIQI